MHCMDDHRRDKDIIDDSDKDVPRLSASSDVKRL